MAECVRPNCSEEVREDAAIGTVSLFLERQPNKLAVRVDSETCSGCSNDLIDWWLYGKKL